MSEHIYFGCPVLREFTQEVRIRGPSFDDEEWADLEAKAANERPSGLQVRGRALLCVAFSVEELNLRLTDAGLTSEAAYLHNIPLPIRSASGLDSVLCALSLSGDGVIAFSVQTKLLGTKLGSEQISHQLFDKIRSALLHIEDLVKHLQAGWDTFESLGHCGYLFGVVCGQLTTPASRRIGYAKALLGVRNE